MAIKTGTVIKLQDCSLGIEHHVAIGQVMLGHAPVDVAPGYDTVRHVLSFATPLDGVMGLFDPHVHTNTHIHPSGPAVQLLQPAGASDNVYLTNGDATVGTPTAPEVHDPHYDRLLATGTGSAYVKLNQEFLPGQRLRVVLGTAAVVNSRVIAMFCNTIGAGGRLLG